MIIHLGMPKAGSTSIQLALHAAQDACLTPNGLWFKPPNGEFSDYVLYDFLHAQDLPALKSYIEAKIVAATTAGADAVIFSAERLFTIDSIGERMVELGRILQEWSDDVCFAIVVREIKPFLRSYIVQMIYNGSVPIEDGRLAEWMIGQAQTVEKCGFPLSFVSLDDPNSDRNVAERLLRVSIGRDIRIDLQRMNVTPRRPLIYAMAEGVAARFHALDGAADVNSRSVDQFRREFMESFDRTMHSLQDPEDANRMLNQLNSTLEQKIDRYIDQTVDACDPAKLAYYNSLVKPSSRLLLDGNNEEGLGVAA